jgi:hypothetical protein
MILRACAYLLAAMVLTFGGVALWAAIESRRPGVSPEVLMAIPGTSVFMFFCGLLMAVCIYVLRSRMDRWELGVLGVIATIGVSLLPGLIVAGF